MKPRRQDFLVHLRFIPVTSLYDPLCAYLRSYPWARSQRGAVRGKATGSVLIQASWGPLLGGEWLGRGADARVPAFAQSFHLLKRHQLSSCGGPDLPEIQRTKDRARPHRACSPDEGTE